jgi:hypothetical protein
MKDRILLCGFFLTCLLANTIAGQTAAQIKEKYGQPIEAYSVSEHIWMTPEFTADGQVCLMRLYPKRISATTNYVFVNKLNYRELEDVLNQLAPIKTRGNRTMFFGFTIFGGQMKDTFYSYDKVSFSFLSSFIVYNAVFKTRSSPTSEKEQPKDEKTKDEMRIPRDAEIVTIAWTERPCAK